jgi:hypothetical protein
VGKFKWCAPGFLWKAKIIVPTTSIQLEFCSYIKGLVITGQIILWFKEHFEFIKMDIMFDLTGNGGQRFGKLPWGCRKNVIN